MSVGRIDDIREVHRNGVGAADLAVVRAYQPPVQRVRAHVDAGESVRAVEREVHLDGVVVHLEVDVIDPGEIARRRVRDVDRAPVVVDPSAGAVMTSFGAFGPGVTGFAMSVWISAWLSAARYTRTSSIRPLKYSPYGLLPPIHNGLAVVAIGPVRGEVATCTPFTYRRRSDPSYVIARCDHAPTGNALGAKIVGTDPAIVTPAAGRNAPASLLACNRYESASFCTTARQLDCAAAGYTHASNVTADVRSNDAESSTRTRALDPLNDNADPNFPEVVHVAPCNRATVPVPRHVGDGRARPFVERVRRDESRRRRRRRRPRRGRRNTRIRAHLVPRVPRPHPIRITRRRHQTRIRQRRRRRRRHLHEPRTTTP